MAAAVDEVMSALVGPESGSETHTRLELHALIEAGLPYEALTRMATLLGMSVTELATGVLQIPARTLVRRRERGRLPAAESDRLYRLARVVAHAVDVFDDDARASAWLRSPNLALADALPLDLLATDAGTHEVVDLLGRIEYGLGV